MNNEVLRKAEARFASFVYEGCLDNIKIHFTVTGETVSSLRTRLRKAVQEVSDNFIAIRKGADDAQSAYLQCITNFFWIPFNRILDSLIRKERGEVDEEFIEGEFVNEYNRMVEDVVGIIG